MLSQMFMFEWRYFTRQPSFYVSALMFLVIAFLAASLNQLGMGGGNVFKNGPYLIGQIMGVLSIFSMFLVVNFVGSAAMRDHGSQMAEILYSKPINPLTYQLGRFVGAFAVVVCVYSAVPVGLIIGSLMPWVSEARTGPIHLSYYLTTFVYLAVPTLFIFSCLFYAVAIRVKSMMAVYLAVIAVIILYEISDAFLGSPTARSWAALLDPFALQTFEEITRYWTIFEKNNQVLTLSGTLLENRAIWLVLGLTIMAVFGGFSRTLALVPQKAGKKSAGTVEEQEASGTKNGPISNQVDVRGRKNAGWQHFFTLTRFEVKQVVFDPSFYVLCGFMFLLLLAVLFEPKGMFGGVLWPLTQNMVQMIRGSMGILGTIIITYYCAEIVWRERSSGMGDIVDSMPVFNLSFWLSKLVAVWVVLALLLLFSMGMTMLFQLGRGYTQLEAGQYLVSLGFYSLVPWMMMSVLAFLLQVLSPNKYAGMFLFVLFILSGLVMEPLGLGHNMFRFSRSPEFIYTDLNGYGPSFLSHSWYMFYWGSLSVIFSIIGYGLWQRGPVQGLKSRIKRLPYQLGSRGKMALAASAILFVIGGSVIHYNTRVLNPYITGQENFEIRANYEKHYGQYAGAPVPIITKLNASVDIYPAQRRVEGSADIVVTNRSSEEITKFLVAVSDYQPLEFAVEIEGGRLGPVDGELNTYWFEFDQPLQPGEERKGSYRTVRQQEGFVDKADTTQIVENGTFINNTELFPRFGYQKFSEISDRAERKKRGLPPPDRFHKLEEKEYYRQTILGPESGHLEFETTVSTAIDQIALAPGYLQKEWVDNNRRYFHYKMDAPIENYFAYLSARYETVKTRHKGVDVEIYYHAGHEMNIDRMQQAVVDSIDYFSENFGPYQHRQARVIEFPGYRDFAQSFPNTIAFSERIGFVTDLRKEEAIDQVYYVTAHEMAHQWWGGQVDGANVQGSTMIVETLAQYSALMLTRQKYGNKKLRGILNFELDRYLRGRTRELVEELPLMRVENQPYIHYRKGSVSVMALVDLLGEERMNQALSDFLARFKFSQDPYPTTLDLMSFVAQDATESEHEFIKSIFEQINLYDLRAKEVAIEELDNDQFEVTLTIDAHRINADGQGEETQVPLSEMIDVGLFMNDPDDLSEGRDGAEEGKPLYLEKHLITDGENVIRLVVSKKPLFAGIDPFVKLIDRDSADNIIEL